MAGSSQEAAAATAQERLADATTALTGSMRFVYPHLAIYCAWILAKVGVVPGISKLILRS